MNNKIFSAIKKALDSINKSTILLGVDGGQGSGKSTFIIKLTQNIKNYNVQTIEIDDFLIERNKRENLPESFFNDINNLYFFFDFDRMKKTIQQLSSSKNKIITLKNLYNIKTGKKDRKKEIKLKEKNLIIIGGPYLLNFKLDLKIFLKVDINNRLNNTLKRTLTKSRSVESQKILFKKFEKFYKPYYFDKMRLYNIIIDNNIFSHRQILSSTL